MTVEEAVGELRKLSPASLRVELENGETRQVAMPRSGNRWARIAKTLERLSWLSIECLDKDGRVVGVVADVPEQDDPAVEVVAEGATAAIMLQVMRVTASEMRMSFAAQSQAMASMAQVMSDGVRAISEAYQMAIRVQTASAVSQPGGDDEVMAMMKQAMMLQFAPSMLGGVQTGGRTVPPVPRKVGSNVDEP